WKKKRKNGGDLSHWCGELIHKKQNYQTVIMKPPVYINYDCFLEKGLQD
ncbi:340_t:CDS:1, partial [Rhizophagus irregularis]